MAADLRAAMERLHVSRSVLSDDFCVDDLLFDTRSRKRARLDADTLKSELEGEFLQPPTTFGPEWLDRLQQ
jgi:hypothetical protein